MTKEDLINGIAKKRGFTTYLEIGVQNGNSLNKVNIPKKWGVDPDPNAKATHQMTSDEFFKAHDRNQKFDLIFIDGDHERMQASSDIFNAMLCLRKGGVIVVHDCLPVNEKMQRVPRETKQWVGDVWAAFAWARETYSFESFVVDTDWGCGVINTAVKDSVGTDAFPIEDVTYDWFLKNKEKALNIKTVEWTQKWIENL